MNAVQQLTLKSGKKVSWESSFSLEECKRNLYCGYEFLPPDIPYIVCLPSHGQQQYV